MIMYMLCQKPVWSERTHWAQQALIVIRHSDQTRPGIKICAHVPLTPSHHHHGSIFWGGNLGKDQVFGDKTMPKFTGLRENFFF